MRHLSAILRYAKLSNGEYLAKAKTVTGDKHVMPWRVEDEMKKLGDGPLADARGSVPAPNPRGSMRISGIRLLTEKELAEKFRVDPRGIPLPG